MSAGISAGYAVYAGGAGDYCFALCAPDGVAQLGGWLDLPGLHHCAAERAAAFLCGYHRPVYFQDVSGNQAPPALYHC